MNNSLRTLKQLKRVFFCLEKIVKNPTAQRKLSGFFMVEIGVARNVSENNVSAKNLKSVEAFTDSGMPQQKKKGG